MFDCVEQLRTALQSLADADDRAAEQAASAVLVQDEPVVSLVDDVEGASFDYDVEMAADTPAAEFPDMHISTGTTFTDRKSTFQAHAARVSSKAEVSEVMSRLLSVPKIARATHNIMAYRYFDRERRVQCSDNDEDGEDMAGARLAHLLEMMGVNDVVVVVTRWYGGIHLGSDRFRHINNMARGILEEAGLVEEGGGGKKLGGKSTSGSASAAKPHPQKGGRRRAKR